MNILLVYFLRTEKKYWFISISIWTMLIASIILWRQVNETKIDKLDHAYWKSAEINISGDNKIYKELIEAKSYFEKYNLKFIHAIFVQTILTFAFQIVGFKRTSLKRTYQWTAIIFCFLTLFILFLEISLSAI